MPLRPWNLLQKSLVFSALPWLEIYREAVELPDGRVLDDFYRVELPEFSVTVPVTDEGELVMVRGYKHGVGRVSLSVPSGYLVTGESPLEAAKRELLEETGYSASEWHKIGRFLVDGNRHCGLGNLWLARHAIKTAEPSQPDPNEEVEVHLVDRASFFEAIRTEEVAQLTTACAVSLALLFEQYGPGRYEPKPD